MEKELKQEFTKINQEFIKFNKRFDAIEDQLMDKATLEHYFTSIQESFNEVSERYDRQDRILKAIYGLVSVYEDERREFRQGIDELKKRVAKLEKQTA